MIVDKQERADLWDYLDAGDVLEIVDALGEQHAPAFDNIPDPWGDGYSEALDDIRHAATLDGAGGFRLVSTREHFEHWTGYVATTASDHGYCNAIEDMLNSISKLIAQRY